jgi:microcystin-dependent protein
MSGPGTITFSGLDGKFNLTHNMEIGQNLVNVPSTTSDSTMATTAFVHLHMPTGMVVPYAGSSAPSGWLLCDGREVAKADYPVLYAVIGTTYGSAGDPSHNFVLPNLGGRTVFGTNGSSPYQLAQIGGNANVTLSNENLPAHNHTGTTDANGTHSHGVTDPGHTHTQTTHQDDYNGNGGNPPGFMGDAGTDHSWSNINSAYTNISILSAGSHSHSFTTSSVGSGSSFSILPPYLALNYLIKAV